LEKVIERIEPHENSPPICTLHFACSSVLLLRGHAVEAPGGENWRSAAQPPVVISSVTRTNTLGTNALFSYLTRETNSVLFYRGREACSLTAAFSR
jgi:hypothetical protein